MLPTDQRYRNLNKLQKLVLAYKINDVKDSKFDINKVYLNNLKAYINPNMYQEELKMTDPKHKKFEKYNHEFAQHSATGRQLGKPKLSPIMQKAIDKSVENRQNSNVNRIMINNMDDFVEGKEKVYDPKTEPKVKPKKDLSEKDVEAMKATLQEALNEEDEIIG